MGCAMRVETDRGRVMGCVVRMETDRGHVMSGWKQTEDVS